MRCCWDSRDASRDVLIAASVDRTPCRSAERSLDIISRVGQSGRVSQRSVRPLDASALAALTTDRLLAYRSRLLELEDSASNSDLDGANYEAPDPSLIYFKADVRWAELYAAVKSLLAGREHVS